MENQIETEKVISLLDFNEEEYNSTTSATEISLERYIELTTQSIVSEIPNATNEDIAFVANDWFACHAEYSNE